MNQFSVVAHGITHQGRHREKNQDQFLVNRKLNLFAVADGVEEAPFGEIASRMAVEELGKIITGLDLSQDATPPFEDHPALPLPARALKYALREVNRRLYDFARQNPKYQGMGTTLTTLWLTQGKAYIGHIGDSRAYLVRNGIAQQLTQDHTTIADRPVQQTEDLELYEEISHISEHELTRVVGINPDLMVQLAGGTPHPGDRFVLCTDGLYGMVRDFEIAQTVEQNPPQLACRKLIELANQRGGIDNIALVVIQIG